MRPRAPVHPGLASPVSVMTTCSRGWLLLQRRELAGEDDVGLVARREDQVHVAGPGPIGEVADHRHERRDADSAADERHASRRAAVAAGEHEPPRRRRHLQPRAFLHRVVQVARGDALLLALHGDLAGAREGGRRRDGVRAIHAPSADGEREVQVLPRLMLEGERAAPGKLRPLRGERCAPRASPAPRAAPRARRTRRRAVAGRSSRGSSARARAGDRGRRTLAAARGAPRARRRRRAADARRPSPRGNNARRRARSRGRPGDEAPSTASRRATSPCGPPTSAPAAPAGGARRRRSAGSGARGSRGPSTTRWRRGRRRRRRRSARTGRRTRRARASDGAR